MRTHTLIHWALDAIFTGTNKRKLSCKPSWDRRLGRAGFDLFGFLCGFILFCLFDVAWMLWRGPSMFDPRCHQALGETNTRIWLVEASNFLWSFILFFLDSRHYFYRWTHPMQRTLCSLSFPALGIIEKTRIPPHIWPLVQPASLAVVYLDLRMDPMLSTLIACCVCVCVSKPTYSLSFIFFLFQCKHVRWHLSTRFFLLVIDRSIVANKDRTHRIESSWKQSSRRRNDSNPIRWLIGKLRSGFKATGVQSLRSCIR